MEHEEDPDCKLQEESEEGLTSPHEALFLALSYLPVYELLVMNRVCSSLRDAVRNDVLPWLNIMVRKPINKRLNDQHLLNLTSKANGRLKTLALFNCTKITDDGLLQVVAANPFITQLWLPGCTRLTPSAVIEAVKLLSKNSHKLNSLMIGGIQDISKEDLTILHHLVDDGNQSRQKRKLILHRGYHDFSISQHYGPAIDVSICPICNEVKAVFDCPRDSCKGCRGCKFCIPRCEECGLCIQGEDDDAAEAACDDSLCLGCWLQLQKCSFCNKPYCTQHADQQHSLSGSSGFVCANCQARFIDNTDSYED